MTQIRAVIIDDDRNRRELIKNSLPEYIESIDIGFGEGAIDYIKIRILRRSLLLL